MDLSEAKEILKKLEPQLKENETVEFAVFERDGRDLTVYLTARLQKLMKKARLWKSKQMLATLKNAEYGFREETARSRGGSDGIFLLDRNFRPENEMMRKMFGGFLDKENSGVEEITGEFETDIGELKPVRLVSHHMRLLGILIQEENEDFLVLVDFDMTK